MTRDQSAGARGRVHGRRGERFGELLLKLSWSLDRLRLNRSRGLASVPVRTVPSDIALPRRRSSILSSAGMPIFIVFAAAAGLGSGLTISSFMDAGETATSVAHASAKEDEATGSGKGPAEAVQADASAATGTAGSAQPIIATGSTVTASVATRPAVRAAPIAGRAVAAEPGPAASMRKSVPDIMKPPAEAAEAGADGDLPLMAMLPEPAPRARDAVPPAAESVAPAEDDTAKETEDATEAAPPEVQQPGADAEEPEAEIGSQAAVQRRGRIRTAVNLRTGPNNRSRVLKVVPTGASVGVVDCDSWCEIVADGTRGFIYKSYLAGGGSEAEAPRSAERVARRDDDDDRRVEQRSTAVSKKAPQSVNAPVFDTRP